MNFQYVRNAVGLALLLVSASPLFAATNIKPSELAVLPAYCDAKVGSQNPAAADQWLKQMGRENWDHLHHYCGGLIELNRYYGGNAAERKKSLRAAMWEFDYVIKYTQPDFYLRADMHYNRGKVWRLQGNDGKALADFQKALELSAGMPSATNELADIYKKLGQKANAVAVLKTALEQFPNNKGLRRRYQELGGDLSLLTPPPPAPSSSDASTDKSPATPFKVEAEKVDAVQVESPQTAPEPPKAEAVEPAIGNATNPWCRFCPDPAPSSNEKR